MVLNGVHGVKQWHLPEVDVRVESHPEVIVHYEDQFNQTPRAGVNTLVQDLRLKELGLYVALFLLVYGICVLLPYGMTDAYTKVDESLFGHLSDDDYVTVAGGRPLLAVLSHLTFSLLHSYTDLRFLNFDSILGLALLAWTLYTILLYARMPPFAAFMIPVLIAITPAFQVYSAWSVCAFYPYAGALATMALLAAENARRKSGRFLPDVPLLLVSMLLLSLSMLIYQPAAMMFWVGAAILIVAVESTYRTALVQFSLYSVVMGVALIADFVAIKVGPVLMHSQAGARSTLVTDYPGKIHWFVHEALFDSLNLFNILPTITVAVLVGSAALVGLLLYPRGSISTHVVKAFIGLMLVPLAYLPSLLTTENWASYRTQDAITALFMLYVCLALLALRKLRVPALSLVPVVTLIALSIVGAYSAARNVTRDIAIPQYIEMTYLRSQLPPDKLAGATSIYFIPATYFDAAAPVARYDEFGSVSSSVAWSEVPMVHLMLHDAAPPYQTLPVVVAPSSGPLIPPKGSIVVDMRTLRQFQLTTPVYHG